MIEHEPVPHAGCADDDDQRMASIIRKHGVFIQYVSADVATRSTTFAYTVGLFGLRHPELLVLGVDQGTAANLLNDVAARVMAGRQLAPGETLSFEGWPHRVHVETVPNPGKIAFMANDYYQRTDEASVPLLQLTYDDMWGRFPWESGYAIPTWIQPRPGELAA